MPTLTRESIVKLALLAFSLLGLVFAVLVFVFVALTAFGPVEDDPGFDCRLHGNHICGPTAEFPEGKYFLTWRVSNAGIQS